jgi:nucleotide-binding universal stress UspA family protein
MKVLVAIDGPDHCHPAVEALASQQLPLRTEVRVISVVDARISYSGGGIDMGVNDVMEKRLRESALAAVQKAAATLRADGNHRSLTVTTEVLSGAPEEAILEDAEAFGADWIFVGSHRSGRLDRFMLGSVSQAVAGRAKCSVAIVRSSQRRTDEAKTP